ncbi:CheR family methyltransferase [Pokkaliibacter sp. MBI-7]|uniref:CheR family methyltransferase n=1 Tax=Pokkaliibacter sp. MBI-7 TaxID=3040600 RepID=UPI002448B58C|nr:CheR family methyltransferase [Pokkaliibacter sp. MBI-7]MDH2432388.1 CheR family methyltransferase [Pokkaliibacter sp. MBI-7]
MRSLPCNAAADPLLNDTLLSGCQDAIALRWGLQFGNERRSDLLRHLQQAAARLGDTEPLLLARSLVASQLSPEQQQALCASLTVGETYFLRDRPFLQHLTEHFLGPLIAERRHTGQRHLKVWSAGCSSGEEAYTLAILLDQLLPDVADWQVQILATDINPDALAKARRGCYSAWSFRSAEPQWRQRYFDPCDGQQWQIKPYLRQRVSFYSLNLADEALSAMSSEGVAGPPATAPSPAESFRDVDLILCRHVLMYFVPTLGQAALRRLHRCLSPDGAVILAAVENTPSQVFGLEVSLWPGALCVYQQARCREQNAMLPAPPEGLEAADISTSVPVAMPTAAPPMPVFNLTESTHPLPAEPSTSTVASVTPPTQGAVSVVPPPPDQPDADQGDATEMTRARALADQGDYAQAEDVLRQQLQQQPTDVEAHWLLAMILLQQERWPALQQQLRKVLYLSPLQPMVHYHSAQLARRQQQAELSQRHLLQCRRLLARLPADQVLWGSDGLSVRDLQQLLERHSDNREAS